VEASHFPPSFQVINFIYCSSAAVVSSDVSLSTVHHCKHCSFLFCMQMISPTPSIQSDTQHLEDRVQQLEEQLTQVC